MTSNTIIRAFDGSLADAEGLLAVEKATFEESPYSGEQIRTMLTDGPQRAWLAIGDGRVVGFTIAFLTSGLAGPCWEIDVLAVHPDWSGRGLGTRLVRAASAHGAQLARRARALVANDNPASARAFARVGFQKSEEAYRLLIHRAEDTPLRPWTALGVSIRETADATEAARWLPADLAVDGQQRALLLLLAEQDGRLVGCAELIEVETLLYRGIWIESLQAETQMARSALVHAALRRAFAAGLDEVGAVVPGRDRPWQEALLAAGFRSLGDFYWLTARLPLPGLADRSAATGDAHV